MSDPKIMWYENGQIRVRKHDKSAYAVIIMDFPCTLPYTNKLIYAVNDVLYNSVILLLTHDIHDTPCSVCNDSQTSPAMANIASCHSWPAGPSVLDWELMIA